MSEEPPIFKNLKKLIEDVKANLIDPYFETLASKRQGIVLPPTRIAIFWDYENFQLPKEIPSALFLEALFPLGLNQKIIAKRVYSLYCLEFLCFCRS